MSSRAGSRLFNASRAFRTPFRKPINRRFESTSSAPTAEAAQSPFQRLWNSPVGMKTVHFWAPVMKWALVIAGISDLSRPAENLSLTQNLALTATGAIWTRWCFIIKPKNVLLATVNFFLGCVGITQVTRIYMYRQSVKDKPVGELVTDGAKDVKDAAKGVVEDVETAARKVLK